ncbi:hypothetical protein HG717_00125 [Rhodococcus erythropolis]|uniref:hypothetical protein n=1 Tax=Rhodococcus erythropolis TaxID=1833 RepID=UPI001C9B924E|nr:hypothetical protein [Rhodococcus erythropolis]MBY6382344.1 hypothetical protein [Rhodococcus erythropolis]
MPADIASTDVLFATATRLVLDPGHVSIESVDRLLDCLPQKVRIKVVQNMVGRLGSPGPSQCKQVMARRGVHGAFSTA